MREDAQAKGRRYVSEGRLLVRLVKGDHVEALAKGDGALYRLGHDRLRGWYCTCPCVTDRCSHLAALRLVVVARQP